MMDEKMMFIMMIFLAATFMILIDTIFKNIKQWRKNNASPVLSVPATVYRNIWTFMTTRKKMVLHIHRQIIL